MAGIYIQMLSGTGRDGDVLRLAGRQFLLGRGNGCEVRVDSEVSSREHASVVLEDDAWMIRDRDSRNGTILNGRRISQANLRPLDEIQLGAEGPTLRLVTMEPAPSIAEQGEDPTRMMRVKGGERDSARPASVGTAETKPADVDDVPIAIPIPDEPSPVSEASPPLPPPPIAPPEQRRRRRMPPLLALAGLAFAASVALGVWGPRFPYEPATAPILWCMAALRYAAPNAIPDPGTQLWVFRGLLAAYGLIAGFTLQRPIRRIVLLVVLACVHVLAALAL